MLQNRRPFPRRLKPARYIAVGASIAAVVLAILPAAFGAATYDATVAVLTATLIAVVWYTFFAFWAATREDPAFLRLDLSRAGLHLQPVIGNPTRRTVTFRCTMRVWIGGQEVPQSEFYRGNDSVTLPPEGRFQGSVDLRPYFKVTIDDYGDPMPEHGEALVVLSATWEDDLGESGATLPRYYRVPFYEAEITSVVARTNLTALFPESAFSGKAGPRLPAVSEARTAGFVRTVGGRIEIHRLREPITDLRNSKGRKYEAESLSGGTRKVSYVGDGWATFILAPGDVRLPLSGWIRDGADVALEFRSDIDAPESSVSCTLLVNDTTDLLASGWHQRPLRVRVAPRGDTLAELLKELLEAL